MYIIKNASNYAFKYNLPICIMTYSCDVGIIKITICHPQ